MVQFNYEVIKLMGAGKGTTKRVSSKQGDGWLRKNSDYRKVYNGKNSRSNRELIIYSRPQDDDANLSSNEPRFGITVTKKVGNAVTRNRLRRVLVEAIKESGVGEIGNDYVIVVRKDLIDLDNDKGVKGVARSLKDVYRKL